MALYRYFKPATDLPNPKGSLSKCVSPATIKDANEAVKNSPKPAKSRGTYAKLTPKKQAEIAQYAVLHGNKAAIHHFSQELGFGIKESSVSTWKSKYQAELKRVRRRGRPLLLGEKLDTEVKSYIQAVHEAGGVITTSISIAATTAIVRRSDRNLLSENGGPITLTNNWAKSLLYRLNFVKRRGSSTAKMTVKNFEELKEQFLLDIKAVVDMEDVPPELVFNWDQTGISIVPGSSWTMELKGSKHVEIVGISDKRQITAVFCGTMAGGFLPLQLIYQGNTTACLPHYKFPDDWHVTYTPNHWSNKEKMKEYVNNIILPC